jgi:hypothetical protein
MTRQGPRLEAVTEKELVFRVIARAFVGVPKS